MNKMRGESLSSYYLQEASKNVNHIFHEEFFLVFKEADVPEGVRYHTVNLVGQNM